MFDHLIPIVTGLTYLAASMCLAVVVRLLGPTYHTKVTAPWWVIGFFSVCAGGLFWRGVTLLFPGRLVRVSDMSLVAPLTAFIMLGLVVFILDFVLGDRSPPPLFDRYFSWAVRQKVSAEKLVEAGFKLPPALHTAAPGAGQISRTGRRTRLAVLISGGGVILGVLGLLALNSPA